MTNLGVIKKALLTTAATCMVGIPILVGFAVQAAEEDNDDILPIDRTAPTYPPEALGQGLSGHVDLAFTITSKGATEDIVVVRSTSPLFEESAILALTKFKYAPVDSAIPNVRIRIAYELESGDNPQAE